MVDQISKTGAEPSVIFCCALGPIHPLPSKQPTSDMVAVQAELEFLRSLLATLQSVRVHVVFISTVLAVSSGVDRYYYSGWKRIIDSAIDEMTSHFQNVQFSVVYPGRLVEERPNFQSWLSTTYCRAAQIIERVGRGTAIRKVIGIDSRLLLAKRSLVELWAALTGNVR
jgi:hypothetical protein